MRNTEIGLYFLRVFILHLLHFTNSVNSSFFSTAVQHERGPRNSTIRRQVAMYLKETSELGTVLAANPYRSPFLPAYVGYEHVNDGITVSAVDPPPTATPGVIMQPVPKVGTDVSTIKPNQVRY